MRASRRAEGVDSSSSEIHAAGAGDGGAVGEDFDERVAQRLEGKRFADDEVDGSRAFHRPLVGAKAGEEDHPERRIELLGRDRELAAAQVRASIDR